ncbi:MAG: NigD-like protein [Prevotella sp.]|jgi:hypothetical protein|nr:NigD-like protein [uncultured Prevotella sp.]MCI1247281.1 NigD-like protein [Prevotella sp.]
MNKTLRLLVMGLIVMTTALSLQSCLDDDDDNYDYYYGANALVTLKSSSSGHLLLQLDDSTLLYPVNMSSSPYGNKELRALVKIRDPRGNEGINKDNLADSLKNVYVSWIDSVRTKPMAPSYGVKNDSIYGNDPLELVDSWMTVSEDGYLTVNFRTYFGNGSVHTLNLVKGDSTNVLELHQDANGDHGGRLGDGIIAFRLDSLVDTKGEYKTFTLKWKSFDGIKSHQFKYRTRK